MTLEKLGKHFRDNLNVGVKIQARIAQLVAYGLGTGEVPGSNPGKGENFSMKVSNYLNLNGDCVESICSMKAAHRRSP